MLRLADDVGTRHEVSLSLSLPLLPLSLPTRKWRSLEKLEARAISMLCAHGARVARYALRVCWIPEATRTRCVSKCDDMSVRARSQPLHGGARVSVCVCVGVGRKSSPRSTRFWRGEIRSKRMPWRKEGERGRENSGGSRLLGPSEHVRRANMAASIVCPRVCVSVSSEEFSSPFRRETSRGPSAHLAAANGVRFVNWEGKFFLQGKIHAPRAVKRAQDFAHIDLPVWSRRGHENGCWSVSVSGVCSFFQPYVIRLALPNRLAFKIPSRPHTSPRLACH